MNTTVTVPTTPKEIPCELCTTPTRMTGTKRCDRCWELETRISDDPDLAQRILAMVMGTPSGVQPLTNFKDVQAFHDKFGLDAERPDRPAILPADLARFRMGFLVEELAEYAEACGAMDLSRALHTLAIEARNTKVIIAMSDLAKAVDALVDLSVVTLGTADFHGVDWQAHWNEVQRANMSKERAAADGSNSKRASKFDVIKPHGWQPPNHLPILLRGIDV